jgi:hypothetical protein
MVLVVSLVFLGRHKWTGDDFKVLMKVYSLSYLSVLIDLAEIFACN